MRIKYLGAKILLVFATVVATPIVWAALAWPEWSAASPADEGVIEVASAMDVANAEPPVLIQPIIHHRIVVVPRYVEVEATQQAVQSQPVTASAAPPAAPSPVPTLPPTAEPPQAAMPAQPRTDPWAQQQQQTASTGSAGTGTTGGASSSSSNQSTSSAPASNSRTRGS